MPAQTAPTGYSRLQIALHWLAFLLIAQQYLFKDAISAAWDRIGEGLEAGFDPLVLAHVASGALVMTLALHHQFALPDGTLARMRRPQG